MLIAWVGKAPTNSITLPKQYNTFLTSIRDADTPGLVGIMSLLPAKAADKSVDCVNEVLFGTCSKDCKDVCLVVSVEEIGGEPAEATPDNSEESTQPLDAFFANVLSAAAKDDAPCD